MLETMGHYSSLTLFNNTISTRQWKFMQPYIRTVIYQESYHTHYHPVMEQTSIISGCHARSDHVPCSDAAHHLHTPKDRNCVHKCMFNLLDF